MRHLYHILSQSSGIMEERVVNVFNKASFAQHENMMILMNWSNYSHKIKSDKTPSWTWEGIRKHPQLAENVCAIVGFWGGGRVFFLQIFGPWKAIHALVDGSKPMLIQPSTKWCQLVLKKMKKTHAAGRGCDGRDRKELEEKEQYMYVWNHQTIKHLINRWRRG